MRYFPSPSAGGPWGGVLDRGGNRRGAEALRQGRSERGSGEALPGESSLYQGWAIVVSRHCILLSNWAISHRTLTWHDERGSSNNVLVAFLLEVF